MKEAIKFHLEGLKVENMPIPETKTMASLSAPARRQAGTGRPDRSRNLKWRRKQCLN